MLKPLVPEKGRGKHGTSITLNAIAQEKAGWFAKAAVGSVFDTSVAAQQPVEDDEEAASDAPAAREKDKQPDKRLTVTAQLKERYGRWQARQAKTTQAPARSASPAFPRTQLSLPTAAPPSPNAVRRAGVASTPGSPRLSLAALRLSITTARPAYNEHLDPTRRVILFHPHLQSAQTARQGGDGLQSSVSAPTMKNGGDRQSKPNSRSTSSLDGVTGGTRRMAASDSGLLEMAGSLIVAPPPPRPVNRLVLGGPASKPAFGGINVKAAPVEVVRLPWIMRNEKRKAVHGAGEKDKRGVHPDRIEERDYSLQTLSGLPNVQLRVQPPTHSGIDLGVSLRFLLQFAESMDIMSSTQEVVNSFIRPQTESTKGRYTDVLPKRFLGRPMYFISHCWSERFYDLICNIFRWFRAQATLNATRPGFIDLDNTYVWMDVFCIGQHQGAQQWDDIMLVRGIMRGCEATLLCLDALASGLSRLWCLYEVWASVCEGRNGMSSPRRVGPPRLAAGKLHVVLFGTHWELARSQVERLDVRTAQVTLHDDRERLLSAMDAMDTEPSVKDVNEAIRVALLESVVAEAASMPAVSPALARCGGDERSIDLFCAAHTKAAGFELLAGHWDAAARRVPAIIALRIAAAEGAVEAAQDAASAAADQDDFAFDSGARDFDDDDWGRRPRDSDGNHGNTRRRRGKRRPVTPGSQIGVLVLDSQLMQVVQLLTLSLREAEMYAEVCMVCEPFHVESVLRGLLAALPQPIQGPAGSVVSPPVGGLEAVWSGNGDDEMTHIVAAYMHLENSLIEATALQANWAGAGAVGPAPSAGLKAAEAWDGAKGTAPVAQAARVSSGPVAAATVAAHRMATAAAALLKMHARAEMLLRCGKRQPVLFRRAIVYGLYNQVVLEYAAVLPAVVLFRANQRASQLEMEHIDVRILAIAGATDALVDLAGQSVAPPPADASATDHASAAAARKLREAVTVDTQRKAIQSEMRALHLRRRELVALLAFPSVGEVRGRLAEIGKWVKGARHLDPTTEGFLRSLRNVVSVEMIVEA